MKYLISFIIILHGLIHLMGFVHILNIAKIAELSQPTIIQLSGWGKSLYGVLWLIAVLVFIFAGIGLLTNQSWWRAYALSAVLLSQVLIVVWWPAAKIGTIPNLMVVAAIFLL